MPAASPHSFPISNLRAMGGSLPPVVTGVYMAKVVGRGSASCLRSISRCLLTRIDPEMRAGEPGR
jgi:hypothetical protein